MISVVSIMYSSVRRILSRTKGVYSGQLVENFLGMRKSRRIVNVVVKQPEVEHKVRMRDFEAWL